MDFNPFANPFGGFDPGEDEFLQKKLQVQPQQQPTPSSLGIQFSGTTGRSATNNNPVNLTSAPYYIKKYGAELEPVSKSGQQKFLKFKTIEDGYNAGLDQIRIDAGRGHTLASFVNKFAPPHENNTARLISVYAKAVGANPNTPLSQIDPEKLIIPMMGEESSTRIVGGKEQEIYAKLKNPGQSGEKPFKEYQIASAGDEIPGPLTEDNPFANPFANPMKLNEPFAQPGQDDLFGKPEQVVSTQPQLTPQERMKQKVLNLPNMGYRPEIVRPIFEMGGGALGAGIGAGVGGGLGAIPGAGLGYAAGKKLADMADSLAGLNPAPTLTESLKQSVKDIMTGSTMETGGQIGGKILPKLIETTGKIAKPMLGKMSGKGTWAIEKSLEGGDMFTKALHDKISGQEVVDTAKGALQEIAEKRSSDYVTELNKIKFNRSKLNNVKTALDDEVKNIQKKFTISTSRDVNGNLIVNMDKSNIVEHQPVVKRALEDIADWTDTTATGLDNLKKRLGTYVKQAGKDTPAQVSIIKLQNNLKNSLNNTIPSYKDMTSKYNQVTSLIDDIESALVKKGQGKWTADQTLRRLTSAMRSDKEIAHDLMEVFGKNTSEDISGMVAGYSMRDPLPSGMFSGASMLGQIILARYVSPEFIPILAASSPRIQGEFLSQYGKLLRETKGMTLPAAKIMSYLALSKKEAKKGGKDVQE